MHRLIYLIIALTCIQCHVQKNVTDPFIDRSVSEGPSDGKAGSCYAKCIMPDEWVGENWDYAVYTGEHGETNSNVEYVDIELKPASTKWVKKRADRNCLSSNPDDCLVWCLVDQPREAIVLPVVVDTSITNQYEWESVVINPKLEPGGHTEWREVVCEDEMNKNLIAEVKHALRQNGYDPGALDLEFGLPAKEALIRYQKDNGLPIGHFDRETLGALRVNWSN